MPLTTCLVVYSSTHGNVRHLARRLAGGLQDAGLLVTVADVTSNPDPAAYEIVVAGGSVHRGAFAEALMLWLRAHAALSAHRPFALFSVSLMAAGRRPEQQAEAQGYLTTLAERTGIRADLRSSFPGALQYREYGRATRLMMRVIARHQGLSTDASRDHLYTDWAAVDDFAKQIACLAAGRIVPQNA